MSRFLHVPDQSPAEPSPAQCEILTWSATTESQQPACQRKKLRSAAELQEELAKIAEAEEQQPKPLVILHGLPKSFLDVLLKDTTTGLAMDPAFLDAHGQRRRYKRAPHGGALKSAATLIYPELVRIRADSALLLDERSDTIPPVAISSAADKVDMLSAPVILHRLPTDSNNNDAVAVLLCRMSLWAGRNADVLFLDRRIQDDEPGLGLRRVARGKSICQAYSLQQQSTAAAPVLVDNVLGEGGEKAYLHETLPQMLLACNGADVEQQQQKSRAGALVDIVYEQWLDLFEDVRPARLASHAGHVLRALDGDFDVARDVCCRERRQDGPGAGFADWEVLVRRLQSHWTVYDRGSMDASLAEPKRADGRRCSYVHQSQNRTDDEDDGAPPEPVPALSYTPSFGSTSGYSITSTAKQSLHRLEILAGILLPFSIASGVLSMDSTFGPGEELFWVFWVITVPLVCLTVLMIVVDKERLRPYYEPVPVVAKEEVNGNDDCVLDIDGNENVRDDEDAMPTTQTSNNGTTTGEDIRLATIQVAQAAGDLSLGPPPDHLLYLSLNTLPRDHAASPRPASLSGNAQGLASSTPPVVVGQQQQQHRANAAASGYQETTRPVQGAAVANQRHGRGPVAVDYDEYGRQWQRRQMGWGRAFASVLGLSKKPLGGARYA